MSRLSCVFVVLCSVLLFVGCESDGGGGGGSSAVAPAAQQGIDVSGSWHLNNSWDFYGTMTLSQGGTIVTGTYLEENPTAHHYQQTATINGSVAGTAFAFTLVFPDTYTTSGTATVQEPQMSGSGTVVGVGSYTFTGTRL